MQEEIFRITAKTACTRSLFQIIIQSY